MRPPATHSHTVGAPPTGWWKPCLLTILVGCLLTATASAQIPNEKTLTQALEKVRGMKFRHAVKSKLYTQQQASDYVRSLFDSEAARTPYAVREGFLQQVGLLPQSLHLRESLRALYGEQVRGLYDPSKQLFLVVQGGGEADPGTESLGQAMGIDMGDLLTVHELDHALQDQYFDLQRVDRAASTSFDTSFAAQCLIEGEAYLVMFDYAAVAMGVDPGMFDQMLGSQGDLANDDMLVQSSPGMAAAPPYVRSLVSDPYFLGIQYVVALRKKGGWTRVNEAYRRLPASTEQILHPEKYLRGEGPVAVSLELPAQVGGMQRLGSDTAGEFTVRAIARKFQQGDQAAAGWGGDRYTTYASPGKPAGVAWLSAWDTDQDAREFEVLAGKVVGGGKLPGRVNSVQRRGRKVLVLRNAPTGLTPNW